MITQVTGAAGSGKTTKAIKQLLESGGGLFITQYPHEVRVFKERHPELVEDFDNKITVVEVFEENIVIDDADSLPILLVVSSIELKDKEE